VSSSSSSSSSGSDSSVGSLPDYDDLKETQLSLAREYLETWLTQPDQPVTKEKLKEAKDRIKQARNVPIAESDNRSPLPGQGPAPPVDLKALRKQYKAMAKQWKALRKEQKRTRKQLRREHKQKRREEKREWRNTKREVRRAERELRRAGGPSHGFPFGIPAPPVPTGAAVPPVPPVPHFGMPRGMPCGPSGPPWSPMGLGHLFGGWGGQNEGQTQGTTQVRDAGAGPSTAPGAWPSDEHGVNRHHRPSQAKYKAAADLEAQVVAKEAELIKMHEAVALEEEQKRNSGRTGGGDHKMQTNVETNVYRLECEIEALSRSMTQLRTQADEEYARELADEDRRGW